ncbi:MAG: hypothetical protein FWF02_07870 [Micrococcales bacterium]|nr:hypothetical protein [Micrococcales bacterium]MCL2667607.1 hypothetical protein [Micrococcales bacterium]
MVHLVACHRLATQRRRRRIARAAIDSRTHLRHHLLGQLVQRSEHLCLGCAGVDLLLVVGVDQDRPVEELVVGAASGWVSRRVVACAVAHERQDALAVVGPTAGERRGPVAGSSQFEQLRRQLGLLVAGDVGWNGLVHGRLSPLDALGLNTGDAPVQQHDFLFALLGQGAQVFGEVGRHGIQMFGRHCVGQPAIGHRILNFISGQIGQAASPLVQACQTSEVVVLLPLAIIDDVVDQPRTAPATTHRAGQVVRVPMGSLRRHTPRIQHVLHLLKQFGRDKRLVHTVVLDAHVPDDTDVVAVHQDVLHRFGQNLSGGTGRCRASRHAASRRCLGQGLQGPLASGVLLE